MDKIIITRGHVSTQVINRISSITSNDIIDIDNVLVFPQSKKEEISLYLIKTPGEYYEICPHEYVRLFFDYDNDKPYEHMVTDNVINCLDQAIVDTANIFNYTLQRDGLQIKPEIIRSNTNISVVRNITNSKHSIHIIYPSIVMKVPDMCKFVNLMKSLEKHKLVLKDIDTQVYRTNPSLRTIHSSKNGNSSLKLVPIKYGDENLSSSDYFITPIDDKYMVLRSIVESSGDNLIEYLEDIFGSGNIVNVDNLKAFASNSFKHSETIVRKETFCPLCNSNHTRPFYLTKSNSNGTLIFRLEKNGVCDGIAAVKPYKQRVISDSTTEKSEVRSKHIAYQIAIDILSSGDLRKTKEGIHYWKDNRWELISKQDLGNIIISYKNNSTRLPVDMKDEIESSMSRKWIVDNIVDVLSVYDFPTPPDSYVMFKNGLVDITTGEFVENSKDYNISRSFNGDLISPGENEQEDMIYKELIAVLRKIVSPVVPDNMSSNTEKSSNTEHSSNTELFDAKQREEDWSRFRQALGSLICGQPTTEIFHFYGHSDGGKSIIVNALLTAFGSYGYKGRIDILKTKGSSTDEVLADYKDKFLTVVSELPRDFVIEEHKLKTITEAMMTADKKYISQGTFRNRARTIVDSNYHLDVNSADSSIRKRVQSFYFRSHFNIKNTEDNYVTREFVRDDNIRIKSESGYYNQAIIRFMMICYRKYYSGSIVPDNRLTLIHHARSLEVKTLLDNGVIDKSSMLVTIPQLINTDYTLVEKYCPILKDLLMSSNKSRIVNQLSLAIGYLPEIQHLQTVMFNKATSNNKHEDNKDTKENRDNRSININDFSIEA